jgi:hypothetical protein
VIGGIDPMDYSLRELWWAMRSRQRAEWERTTALMSWIAAKWTGEKVNPDSINPYIPKPRLDPKIEKKEAWSNIKAGFKALAKRRGRGRHKSR